MLNKTIKTDNAENYYSKAIILYNKGITPLAILSLFQAIHLRDNYTQALILLSKIIQADLPVNVDLRDILIQCLNISNADHQNLAPIVAKEIKKTYPITKIISQSIGHLDENSLRQLLRQLFEDDLFHRYLSVTMNIDADIELFLIQIRNSILTHFSLSSKVFFEQDSELFLIALATQVHLNEYVFFTSQDEHKVLSQLRSKLEQSIEKESFHSDAFKYNIILYALYFPMSTLKQWKNLSQAMIFQEPRIHNLYKLSIENRLIEEKLKLEIEQIKLIKDKTSVQVQQQYEESPYPRWLNIPYIQPTTFGSRLRELFPHADIDQRFDQKVKILIAGGGTGRHPISFALQFKNAQVTVLDLSKSSLAYGQRMANELNVHNINFIHGDILDADLLPDQYHCISGFGSLQCMDDPNKGIKLLLNKLVKGGFFHLGLYSEVARKFVVDTRNDIKSSGITTGNDSIRKFRYQKLSLAQYDDVTKKIISTYEFYNLSNCRDFLFHVKEHRHTLPQIKQIINDNQLSFLGFRQNPFVYKQYRQQFPDDINMTNIDHWDQLESQDSLLFFYSLYDFWCQR